MRHFRQYIKGISILIAVTGISACAQSPSSDGVDSRVTLSSRISENGYCIVRIWDDEQSLPILARLENEIVSPVTNVALQSGFGYTIGNTDQLFESSDGFFLFLSTSRDTHECYHYASKTGEMREISESDTMGTNTWPVVDSTTYRPSPVLIGGSQSTFLISYSNERKQTEIQCFDKFGSRNVSFAHEPAKFPAVVSQKKGDCLTLVFYEKGPCIVRTFGDDGKRLESLLVEPIRFNEIKFRAIASRYRSKPE